jgi:hypothetical protein
MFDRHVAALDEAGLGEALEKRRIACLVGVTAAAVEHPDHRHRRLLRAHGERPSDRGADERGCELPSSDADCHLAVPKGVMFGAT